MYVQPAAKSTTVKHSVHKPRAHVREGIADKASSDSEQSTASLDDSWVDVAGQQTNRAKRWFAFSDGPRSCVGLTLANMNMTSTLATLLAHFHFRLADQVCCTSSFDASQKLWCDVKYTVVLFVSAALLQKVMSFAWQAQNRWTICICNMRSADLWYA